MLFDGYFESGKTYFDSVENVNAMEKYQLPSALNDQRCNYIKYGEENIGSILTSENPHYDQSMMH